MPRTLLRLVVAVVVAVVLAGCGGGSTGAGPLDWRDLDLVVPQDWVVIDQRDDLLLLGNEDLRATGDDQTPSLPEDPDTNDTVAAQLTGDPSTSAEDWRELVEQEDGTIEEDAQITVGGLPATSITYRWASNGIPSRERVVFVPSRDLVILLQPVPIQGQSTAPDVFDDHVDEFDALVGSIQFGRPVDG